MDEKDMIFRYGMLWGVFVGIGLVMIATCTFFAIRDEFLPYIKNRKKKKYSNPRKTLPTYTNNLIQFPTKKQG